MFDFVRKHQRIMQWILMLLIFPSFVLFGIQGYNGFTKNKQIVAVVAGQDISQSEWEASQRRQIEEIRQRAPNVSASLFNTKSFREQSLEAVIRDKLLERAAQDQRLLIADARLQQLFANDERYAFLRNPDGTVNQELLRSKGVNSAMFAEQLRHEYALRQVLEGISSSAGQLTQVSNVALKAFTESREVQVARFTPAQFAPQVSVSDAQLKAYYADPTHASDIRAPEQVALEYLVLDMDTVKAQIKLPEEDVRKYYQENKARYTSPEERRVSHILIKVSPQASAQDKQAAHDKAQKLLDQLRKDPASFADVAQHNSDDTGSASHGGDLDFIQRGAMVKPFEDAAFALQPGSISDLVLTDYGYHIIKVTEVRGGQVQPFESVKDAIESEIKGQLAQQEFAKAAERFGNLLEQSDNLQDVAQALKLPVQKADHVTHVAPEAQADAAANPLTSDKFLRAIFDPSNLKAPHNTEPIEIAPNRLAAGHVLHYTPSRTLSFDEARASLLEKVKAQEALRLAREAGEKQLASWKQNPPSAAQMGPVLDVSRQQTHDLEPALVHAAMQAPASHLPAWQGVDMGAQGYAVVQILQVKHPTVAPDVARLSAREYAQLWGAAEALAYVSDLKAQYKAKITPYGQGLIDKADEQGTAP